MRFKKMTRKRRPETLIRDKTGVVSERKNRPWSRKEEKKVQQGPKKGRGDQKDDKNAASLTQTAMPQPRGKKLLRPKRARRYREREGKGDLRPGA